MNKKLEDLKKKREERNKQNEVVVHRHMMKSHNYYRAWFQLDSQFNKWLENPKLNKEQSGLIRKCLINALLLRAEIETRIAEVVQYDFDFWNGVVRRKEFQALEMKKQMLILRKENEALKESTAKMESTIRSQKAEIEYYEKQ